MSLYFFIYFTAKFLTGLTFSLFKELPNLKLFCKLEYITAADKEFLVISYWVVYTVGLFCTPYQISTDFFSHTIAAFF